MDFFGGESHGFQEERRGSVVATEYKGRRTKEIDCQRGEDHNNILEPLGGGGGVSCKFNIVTHQKSLTPPQAINNKRFLKLSFAVNILPY